MRILLENVRSRRLGVKFIISEVSVGTEIDQQHAAAPRHVYFVFAVFRQPVGRRIAFAVFESHRIRAKS